MEGHEVPIIVDLYSYRKRVANGDTPDVVVYDELPGELLVQIVHIWRDAIGRDSHEGWTWIHDTVARERGLLGLGPAHADDAERCMNYLLDNPSVTGTLDLIEASFLYIDRVARDFTETDWYLYGVRVTASDAIDELNERFRRAGVGYQFEDGKIFRVDSELIHSHVVRPALRFLGQSGFEGPRDEFLQAHAHYRAGETKDAITDANNAFESTLKVICDKRGWRYSKGGRASDLLKVVRANGLLPDYLDASFDQLTATLKSGLPMVRNEEGAHGQGATTVRTPDYVAAYALHLAAAKILFLVEAHRAIK